MQLSSRAKGTRKPQAKSNPPRPESPVDPHELEKQFRAWQKQGQPGAVPGLDERTARRTFRQLQSDLERADGYAPGPAVPVSTKLLPRPQDLRATVFVDDDGNLVGPTLRVGAIAGVEMWDDVKIGQSFGRLTGPVIKKRRKGRPGQYRLDEILQLVAEHKVQTGSYSNLAPRFGLTRDQLRNIVNRKRNRASINQIVQTHKRK